MRRISFLLVLVLVLAALAPGHAAAQEGIPDPAFGVGGLATVSTAPAEERESSTAMVIDSRDRVLVGGAVGNTDPVDLNSGWVLVRFRSDGTLDTGFGDAGFARAPGLFGPTLGDVGQEIRALAMAPGSDKVIAGGITIGPSATSEFTVARYDADGKLDMSFGPADTGFIRADVGPGSDSLSDIAVAADGSITAVGRSGLDTGLARWNFDGVPDPTFDGPGGAGNGMFADPVGAAAFEDYRSVELDPSGGLWAVGVLPVGGVGQWLVGSYTATGARNTSFNGTGLQTLGFGGQSDLGGGQVLVGETLYVFGSVDIDPSPKTTRTYGVAAFRTDDGAEIPEVRRTFPLPASTNLFDASLQRLDGSAAPSTERFLLAGSDSNLLRLRRVNGDSAALELDPEFGDGGHAPKPAVVGSWADAAADSMGRVVAGGETGNLEEADFAALRLVEPPPTVPAAIPDSTAPVITGARIAPRAWAVNPRGKIEALLSARRKKAKRGAKIRYSLSESARVVVRVERRKVKRKGRRKRVLFSTIGSFAKTGLAGPNTNPFSGRLGTKRLRPGGYRATLIATDPAGNSSAAIRLAFKIVRP